MEARSKEAVERKAQWGGEVKRKQSRRRGLFEEVKRSKGRIRKVIMEKNGERTEQRKNSANKPIQLSLA